MFWNEKKKIEEKNKFQIFEIYLSFNFDEIVIKNSKLKKNEKKKLSLNVIGFDTIHFSFKKKVSNTIESVTQLEKTSMIQ